MVMLVTDEVREAVRDLSWDGMEVSNDGHVILHGYRPPKDWGRNALAGRQQKRALAHAERRLRCQYILQRAAFGRVQRSSGGW